MASVLRVSARPRTDETTVVAFNMAANGPFTGRFQLGGRWTRPPPTAYLRRPTATTSPSAHLSFVPDGTIVPRYHRTGPSTSSRG